MSDLIDRKALMKEFTMFVRRSNNHDYAPAPTWNDAVSLVGSMPSAEPEMKWIPVTEAMPINDVDVIVSVLDDSGDTPYRFTSVGWCTPNGQYWVVDNEMCYGVIAWMPLPEPWRGE